MPPALKAAYLIHGDDHARIAARRARLRRLAELESGAGGLEVLQGEGATPAEAALALSTMTFALGRRVIIVDGVERWKEREVDAELSAALGAIPPETTIAFFAREEGRAKAPAGLHALVKRAGGAIDCESAVKEWDLPKWAIAHAATLRLTLDLPAARALVAVTGKRQARLERELEKLALECEPGARLDEEAIRERAAGSAEHQAWTLADALLGRELGGALRVFLRLREQGERVEGMLYWRVRRRREGLAVAEQLDEGRAPAEIKRSLRMPPRPAERFIADVRGTDAASLRGALQTLARLEVDTRGGSQLESDTLALCAITAIATA
ncbi:MAG: hypothetical protein NVS1B9_02070 [Solirubrobacteraceae bacterium]